MMEPINAGVIGSGMAARVFHIPVIQTVPELRLQAVVARHGNEISQRHPGIAIVREAAALLADDEIALVVIATPNSSHYELARAALLANKHVVVEKPFTATSEQAQQLIDLAQKRGRVLSVYQNRRWDGDFQTIRKLLDARLLGRLVEYEAHFDRFRNLPRPGAWREQAEVGGGILFDLGSHLIDQAQVLFGLPRMITADIRIQRESGQADDSFDLRLHYDQGGYPLTVTLKAGMLVREPGPHFILHGAEGSFIKYGMDPQEEALKSGLTPLAPNWGEEPRELWGKLNTQIEGLHVMGNVETLAGCYQAFYQNIAGVIAGRAELAVKPEEARNTIRLIELAQQSSAQKQTILFA